MGDQLVQRPTCHTHTKPPSPRTPCPQILHVPEKHQDVRRGHFPQSRPRYPPFTRLWPARGEGSQRLVCKARPSGLCVSLVLLPKQEPCSQNQVFAVTRVK